MDDQPVDGTEERQSMPRPFAHVPTCRARRRDGGECLQPAMKLRRRCRLHGGKSLRGPASPAWRHGKFSTALPSGLRKGYIAALNHPDLLDCRSDIAALDAHLGELVQRLDAGSPSDGRWAALGKALDLRTRANDQGDHRAYHAADLELQQLIHSGENDAVVWKQIVRAIMRRDRLSRSAMRLQVAFETTVPVETLTTVIKTLVDLIGDRCCRPCTSSLLNGVNEILARMLADQPTAPSPEGE